MVNMQTLIFNSSTKRVELLSGPRNESKILETFENVPTVKVENGYFFHIILGIHHHHYVQLVRRLNYMNLIS
jgi:hypothetical protein